MTRDLLSILCCPACGLALEREGANEEWIEDGSLRCRPDGLTFPVVNGMAHVFVDDEHWAPKRREADGWVRFHKDHNAYSQAGVDLDFELPYYPHPPWVDVARQFDIAMELLKCPRGGRILDLGAGRGWAAKQFALRGYKAVAVDVVPDEQIGLGRSRAIMERAGIRFDALIADSERLPFREGSFDVVYCAAVLHHTTDLDLLLENVGRVLKRGGRLIAINEPCIADDADPDEIATSIAEERSYGINETRPRLDDYRRALQGGGLREETIFLWHTYNSPVAPKGPETRRRIPTRFRLTRAARRPSPIPPQAWSDSIIRHSGGGVVIIATKNGDGA